MTNVEVVIEARLHDSGCNPNEGVTVTRRADEAERTVELLRSCGYQRVTIREKVFQDAKAAE